MTLIPIRRALCSVSDRSGLEELAACLTRFGCEIISSGGTASYLMDRGMPVTPVSQVTGFPEILDGRVKTLHPKIHGGLLGIRDNPAHQDQMRLHEIAPIDLVVVNLYPFMEIVSRPERNLAEVIENIDIGGPSMVRSAAKNFKDVAVVIDPGDYGEIMAELTGQEGALGLATRLRLARKVFEHTSSYDRHIGEYLCRVRLEDGVLTESMQDTQEDEFFDQDLQIEPRRIRQLRYGENPHQRAGFYYDSRKPKRGLAAAEILQGKEISYNNLLDLDAALSLVYEFQEPTAVIVKHTNPCGVACAMDLQEAYAKAHEADSLSAFGSVVAVNRAIDDEFATSMSDHFVEAIIAPQFSEKALEAFSAKKNLRLLRLPDRTTENRRWRSIFGGFLLQDADTASINRHLFNVVTTRRPTEAEWASLLFAWRVVKHVKSNAVVLAKGSVTTGIGAGQMSRVESSQIAVRKSGSKSRGSVLASDAFFPFRDGIDVAARSGVVAAIQPGGSRRDEEVIDAANEHGMAMVFTGIRHFRH